jgi:hypothetical protein
MLGAIDDACALVHATSAEEVSLFQRAGSEYSSPQGQPINFELLGWKRRVDASRSEEHMDNKQGEWSRVPTKPMRIMAQTLAWIREVPHAMAVKFGGITAPTEPYGGKPSTGDKAAPAARADTSHH